MAAPEPVEDNYSDTGLEEFKGPIAPSAWDSDEPGEDTPADIEWAIRKANGEERYHANEFERHHEEKCREREERIAQLRADREIGAAARAGDFATIAKLTGKSDWMPKADNDNRPATASRFDLTWFADIDTTQIKKTFVKGVLGEGEFTMNSGLPGSGKSAIMTDIACHVAAGMHWHGRKVKQGFVVYVAAERKQLTERRMAAFRKRHGVGSIPLLVLGGFIDMTSANVDTKAIIATVSEAERQCGQACIWIIIDTLTRVFGPGDQNASKDMGRFVANCDLLLKETGAHVTVIHHTSWSGERGKGAIDLDGAVDVSFMVKKKGGGAYVLELDGANDAEDGVVTTFRMESVTVGEDEDGNPTTAPVIVQDDAKEAAEAFAAAMSGHTAKALEVLRALTRWGGHVDIDAWRRGFYDAYLGDKPGTLKTRFLRARKELVEAGTVVEQDGSFRPADSGTSGTCAAPVPCAADEWGTDIDGTSGTQSLDCADVPPHVPLITEEKNWPARLGISREGATSLQVETTIPHSSSAGGSHRPGPTGADPHNDGHSHIRGRSRSRGRSISADSGFPE